MRHTTRDPGQVDQRGMETGAPPPSGAVVRRLPVTAVDIMHLGERVLLLRQRFDLGPASAVGAILANPRLIAGQTGQRARRRAALASIVGAVMAHRGRDLNTALTTRLALASRPRT